MFQVVEEGQDLGRGQEEEQMMAHILGVPIVQCSWEQKDTSFKLVYRSEAAAEARLATAAKCKDGNVLGSAVMQALSVFEPVKVVRLLRHYADIDDAVSLSHAANKVEHEYLRHDINCRLDNVWSSDQQGTIGFGLSIKSRVLFRLGRGTKHSFDNLNLYGLSRYVREALKALKKKRGFVDFAQISKIANASGFVKDKSELDQTQGNLNVFFKKARFISNAQEYKHAASSARKVVKTKNKRTSRSTFDMSSLKNALPSVWRRNH